MITYKKESTSESNLPVLAICYDFDKTLSPDDMQAQGFIQSLNVDVNEFWRESNTLAKDHDMDNNLAYMYMMATKSYGKQFLTKEVLAEYGSKVTLYNGVNTWFERIRQYGLKQGVQIEHYIISSGLKEMIEGTEMAKMGLSKKSMLVRSCSMIKVLPYGQHKL